MFVKWKELNLRIVINEILHPKLNELGIDLILEKKFSCLQKEKHTSYGGKTVQGVLTGKMKIIENELSSLNHLYAVGRLIEINQKNLQLKTGKYI